MARYCERKKKRLLYLKSIYEAIAGYTLKPQSWRAIKSKIDSCVENKDFESEEYGCAVASFAYSAKFKRSLTSCKNKAPALCYELSKRRFALIAGNTQEEFIGNLYSFLEVSPPRSTRYKFFKKIGGYVAQKKLEEEEKFLLFYSVMNWKINRGDYSEQRAIEKAS